MYLTGVSSPAVKAFAAEHGRIGLLITPRSRYSPADWPVWAADNGCYSAGTYVGDDRYLAWLRRLQPHAERCLWATAPDVVGDAAATLERSRPWLPVLRELGYRAALVAQDGITGTEIPWDEFDVLFVGGTDAFKLGEEARVVCAQATERGKQIHVGRVNSFTRLRIAQRLGAATADGTFLKWNANIPRVRVWFDKLEAAA